MTEETIIIPASSLLHHTPSSKKADVSVVVSLYNYQAYIVSILECIYNQSCAPVELIVVDDASTDHGLAYVCDWLDDHAFRFSSVSVYRHHTNSGLASARNTGISHAISPWIWIQDADNPIAPRALEQCFKISQRVHDRVAVVHPLIRLDPCPATLPPLQGNGITWQRDQFVYANCVDAMALVRRAAWLEVGGYSHIDGGWEDYDFWCKLIDHGWTGVQCPQMLASYTHHAASMTSTTSLPASYRLETILQRRHPWLQCVGKTSACARDTV